MPAHPRRKKGLILKGKLKQLYGEFAGDYGTYRAGEQEEFQGKKQKARRARSS